MCGPWIETCRNSSPSPGAILTSSRAASDRQRLSFPEFVDETLLHIQHATLALKLEDFMRDPVTEFSKIADVMSGIWSGAVYVSRPQGPSLMVIWPSKKDFPDLSASSMN